MRNHKWNKLIVASLAASMLVTGCGSNSSNQKTSVMKRVTVETGEISQDSVVVAVGNEAVRYQEMRLYQYLMERQYVGVFAHKLWKYQIDQNQTLEDVAKEDIIDFVVQIKAIVGMAEDKKIKISNDDSDEALQKAEDVMEKASEDSKKRYGLTVQNLSKVFEDNILANKMFYILTDDVNTNISDEEARQMKAQIIYLSGDDVAKANKICEQAKKATNFLVFARDNSMRKQVEYQIGEDTQGIDVAVKNAALELKNQEISEVIQGDDGFYIVYCENRKDEKLTQERKESLVQEKQNSKFKKKYDKWIEKNEIQISSSFWKTFEL